ncbi:MAG: DUF1080 domain-containing protein [Acidobacteriota bacterium]
MRRLFIILPVAAAGLFAQPAPPVPVLPESGFQPIFDGASMKGWDCDPDFWKVSDGEIIGETTAAHQPPQNIFCIWRGDQPADFELKLQYRLTGATSGNSGIQYRSMELPDVAKWVLKGYQFDIDAQQTYTGQLYEERNRGFLALRGQISYVPPGKKVGSIGSTGDSDQLKSYIKLNDWNDVHIIARGNVLTHLLNGHVMSVTIDDDLANRRLSGAIGIQLHKTPNAMKIEARNIRLKTF